MAANTIIFRQDRIDNINYMFIVGKWPKEINITNYLLENSNNIIQKSDDQITIKVENGEAIYQFVSADVDNQIIYYKLVESVLINN